MAVLHSKVVKWGIFYKVWSSAYGYRQVQSLLRCSPVRWVAGQCCVGDGAWMHKSIVPLPLIKTLKAANFPRIKLLYEKLLHNFIIPCTSHSGGALFAFVLFLAACLHLTNETGSWNDPPRHILSIRICNCASSCISKSNLPLFEGLHSRTGTGP